MKFETKNQRKEYPNHNDSGETLIIHVKSVIPVSTRQQAMEISADMAGVNNNIEFNEDGTMKDIKMDSEQVQILSKNVSRIYAVAAEMVVSWNAEDEDGNKLPINPDTVSLVLGDTICMEVVGSIVNPTKAGSSPKASNSSETNGFPSSSGDEE